MMQAIARHVALRAGGRITTGTLVVHEGNRAHTLGGGGDPHARVDVVSPRAWPKVLRGVNAAVDAYADGLLDTPDLTALLRLASLNRSAVGALRWAVLPGRAWANLRSRVVRNTPRRSRHDISAHYDLGNDLFAAMLDPTMAYSCAVFPRPGAPLEEASVHKLELVCDKLRLGPGDRVVEIGAGWGSFAVHAAVTRGCHVTTTTISEAQHRVAVERAREAGVEHLVEVRADDYRQLRGRYDKLVSLEMIEAVGHRDFGTYFARCSDLLEPDGLMLLQAITTDDRRYEAEKRAASFVKTRVFPNGCLPSPRVIADCLARHTDMRAIHLEDLTPHYAETLRRWRANFEAAAERLDRLGYDERFRRLWRLYLCYCEAGFEVGRVGVVQVVTAKPGHRLEIGDRVGPAELVATG